MSVIKIQKISITDLNTDAIVNAANEGLWAGGGVCGAIFKAAGHDMLQAACSKIGHCDTGSAVITPGFKLKAKYIIHAVGPRWIDGKHGEPDQLYSAYYKSLELAAKNGCTSIGFPVISAGIFGYPVKSAWYRAFAACGDFLDQNPDKPMEIVFAVLNDEGVSYGKQLLIQCRASRYKIAEKSDWKTLDMPEQRETFILSRSFSAQQMAALRKGNIPQEMEDKWFWYMQGNTLYAYRSWTGFLIYQIDFRENGQHLVTVNRDPEQHLFTDLAGDQKRLNGLLDWWTAPQYDYYNEWLYETVENINMQQAAVLPESEEQPVCDRNYEEQLEQLLQTDNKEGCRKYTLEYLKSFEGAAGEDGVGSRSVWHDIVLKKWRLTVQLEETRLWFLSVLIKDDGQFDKFSLDEEDAADSHYEFEDEEAIRQMLYQPGDEELLLDAILIRYAKEYGGSSLLSMLRPYITDEFHYY